MNKPDSQLVGVRITAVHTAVHTAVEIVKSMPAARVASASFEKYILGYETKPKQE